VTAPITAHIHGRPDGTIGSDSTIEIEGTVYPIPERGISRVATHRIWACLEAAGYKPATNYYDDLGPVDTNGVRKFRVVKA
jgi:hypothetical protein